MKQNKKIEEIFFDKHCNEDAWSAFDTHGNELLMKLFIENIKPKKGEKTIDMGCGTGEFSKFMHDLGLDVTGIDISRKAIEHARKNVNNVTFKIGDIEKTGLANNSFDIAMYAGVFHHFPDLKKLAKEAHRILNKNGRLFAFDPNYKSPFMRAFRDKKSPVKSTKMKTENEILVKDEDVIATLKKAGFGKVTCFAINDLTFGLNYAKKLFPFPFYFSIYPLNWFNRFVALLGFGKKRGIFLITIAEK